MPKVSAPLCETTIDGPKTRRWVLECQECAEFNSHRIARLGLEEAVAPYRRIRTQPAGSFLLATTSGEGQILLDGKWQRVRPGSLFMAPPRVLNAFYALPGKPWCFAWLRYTEPHFVRSLVGVASPVRASAGGEELARSIAGLRAEWAGSQDPKILHHWVSLIQAFAQRAAQPIAKDDRLASLWDQVARNLAEPWTLPRLAKCVHASGEYLRRRCQLEMGRSPMHQVTYMRMQRAQTLLETTNDKLNVIAECVGFSDGLVFSRAFKRWVGMNPTEYRANR
jgi:AraC-like DNA-binding protein